VQEFLSALGLLIAFAVTCFALIFRRKPNGSGVPSDKERIRTIDNGLEQSKVGLEHGKERIDASTGSIDNSIDRIESALSILESAKKRSDDLSSH